MNYDNNLGEIIPIGMSWASMPIGFCSRVVTYFRQLPKESRPPKHTDSLLAVLCELTQRQSKIEKVNDVEIETSVRELTAEISPQHCFLCVKTVNNALNWLADNKWVTIHHRGLSTTNRTVLSVNISKVLNFVTSNTTKRPDDMYKSQWENWQK